MDTTMLRRIIDDALAPELDQDRRRRSASATIELGLRDAGLVLTDDPTPSGDLEVDAIATIGPAVEAIVAALAPLDTDQTDRVVGWGRQRWSLQLAPLVPAVAVDGEDAAAGEEA